ncbi:MAG: riboflavin kinase [Merdibacter sp.]
MRFPTANLQMDDAYLLPGKGVYAGSVEVEGKRWPAMINVGKNPTFANDALSIEANIFDFEDNIYGMPVTSFASSASSGRKSALIQEKSSSGS